MLWLALVGLEVILMVVILILDYQGFRCFLISDVLNDPTECSNYANIRNAASPDRFSADRDGFCQTPQLSRCGSLRALETCTTSLTGINATALGSPSGNSTSPSNGTSSSNGTTVATQRILVLAAYENLFGTSQKGKRALRRFQSKLSTTNVVYGKFVLTLLYLPLMLVSGRLFEVGNPLRKASKWAGTVLIFLSAVASGFLLRWGRGFRPVLCPDIFKGADSLVEAKDCQTLVDACGLDLINIFPSRDSFRGPAGVVAACSIGALGIVVTKRLLLFLARPPPGAPMETEKGGEGEQAEGEEGGGGATMAWVPDPIDKKKASMVLPPPGREEVPSTYRV